MRKLRMIIVCCLVLFVACMLCGCQKEVTDSAITISVDGSNVSGLFTGTLENGIPNGNGTFTSDDEKYVYSGEWENGAPVGEGTLHYDGYTVHYPDSELVGVFDGDVVNGIPNGIGTYSTVNSAGISYVYTGEWADGVYNGEGRITFDADDVCDRIGNFTKGDFDPSPKDLVKSYGTRHGNNLNFEISQLSADFINSHEDLFPTADLDTIKELTDTSIELKDISKNPGKFGDKFMKISSATVVQINEVETGFERIPTVSQIIIYDNSDWDSIYYVLYYGELETVFDGDRITCYGLPVAYSSYENVGGGITKCGVLLAGYISE